MEGYIRRDFVEKKMKNFYIILGFWLFIHASGWLGIQARIMENAMEKEIKNEMYTSVYAYACIVIERAISPIMTNHTENNMADETENSFMWLNPVLGNQMNIKLKLLCVYISNYRVITAEWSIKWKIQFQLLHM